MNRAVSESASATAEVELASAAVGDGGRPPQDPVTGSRQTWGDAWLRYRAARFPLARRRLPWVIAATLAMFLFSQHLAIAWVWTESIPAHVVLVIKGAAPRPGELMVYAYEGAPIAGWRHGDLFVKYAAAVAGDHVHRSGRRFWAETVRGRVELGTAKTHSRQGATLVASEPGIVPPGYIYAFAPHPDALDSRYAAAGLVRREAVYGRAVVLF